MVPADYEIVIDGELSPACSALFAPLEVRVAAGRTMLVAHGIDQAALHGIFVRIADLGATLIAVRSGRDVAGVTPG